MRGLGGSLGHIVGDHVKKGAKGGASMAELNMMAKHAHAHVNMPGGRLVRRIKPHCNGALIIHVYVVGARITKTKVLEVLLRWIVNIASPDGDTVRKVRSSPP